MIDENQISKIPAIGTRWTATFMQHYKTNGSYCKPIYLGVFGEFNINEFIVD